MDHAGDLGHHIAKGLLAAEFSVFRDPGPSDDDRRVFIVQARDWPSWYRVTVELVEPTEAELYWPKAES